MKTTPLWRSLALASAVFSGPVAFAAPVSDGEAPPEEQQPFNVSGYLAPAYGTTYRPLSLPRDQWEYGGRSSSAGVNFSGEPLQNLSFTIFLVVDTNVFSAVDSVDSVDTDGDGTLDKVKTRKSSLSGTLMDEVSLSYRPTKWLQVKGGQMRIPFTVPNRSANTALMFPTRSSANEAFNSGSDQGALANLDLFDGRLLGSVGAFNGSSLGLLQDSDDSRGLVYSFRADVNPVRRFAFSEGDLDRGPLRIGIGSGMLYRPAKMFDSAGFTTADVRELRYSAALRAAFRGFYFHTEVLRRQRTDSFTNRPAVATGAYAQSSFYMPISSRLSIQPIARGGYTAINQESYDRTVAWLEGGLAFYPVIKPENPHQLRLIVQYFGERRIQERENAHSAVAQMQLSW